MVIINSKDKYFFNYYQALSLKIDWTPSTYSKEAINYLRRRINRKNTVLNNRSFILLANNNPIACFIGVKISEKDKTNLYAYEQPCIVLVDQDTITKKQTKFFILEIERIINSIDGVFYYKDFVYRNNISPLSQYLLTQGESPLLKFSSFINLGKNESEIKRDIRKSYKSLINKSISELQPTIFDSSNISWDLLNEFRLLHIHESGQETMSVECWKERLEMIKQGSAFLILGKLQQDLVTAGFFTINQSHCYYGSSASRRGLFEKPLFHSVIWLAILYAKNKGCSWFEVGSKVYPYFMERDKITKKEIDISKFKSGFGGDVRAFLEFKVVK